MRTNKTTTTLSAIGMSLLLILSACGGGSTAGQNAGNGGTPDNAVSSANAGSNNADGGAGGGQPAEGTDSSKGGKTTIVFSTFFPDDRFKEAKKKYEAQHPNIEIKLEDVQTDDSHLEAAQEKYQTTMNTFMLAGKGPDLLQMDDLPNGLYIQRHLLVNLDDMIAKDASFNKNDYFTNVLDNAKVGAGLYVMPVSFFLEGLGGDQDAIAQAGIKIDDQTWSWNEFAQISQKLVGKAYPNVITTDPESMLNWMVSDNYSLFVDQEQGKAHFDSASFTGLMQQINKMSADGIIGTQGQSYFLPVQINSPGDYFKSLKGYRVSNMKLYVKPHAQDIGSGGYYQAYRSVAINAHSKVKEQAWDFLKFLMSDQIPLSPYSAGFPINKKLYAQEVAQLKQAGTVPTESEGPLHGVPVKVDNTQLDALESYVAGAVHPTPRFSQANKINDIILEESKAFFSGQKSAEEVAKLIQNKAETYLNE